ncbi:serine hydrolase [Kribbella sp. NPDC050281]|uniref:serine hydrolase domain-containing protein n=1 Tax=Kribbella sp. NPDC050281 TaxID=3155515 RepID=UPI003409115B
MDQEALLPRSVPSEEGVDATGVSGLLERLEEQGIECHSLMVVRRGRVIAEGWWAPYSAERPHLLYSLTKSIVGVAVGMAVDDGLIALDDRVVDILPEHVPDPVSARAAELTVHHLLSMSTGHEGDVLEAAWALEPHDLVRGFLRIAPDAPVGSRHAYNNPTTFVLARMIERVTGRDLPELLSQRLFGPMEVTSVDWERLRSGVTFGFHGAYLTTEAIVAFGLLLLQGGQWRGHQLVSQRWVEMATRRQIETVQFEDGSRGPDWLEGYGYHFWRSRYGYRGDGAMGQLCLVVPEQDLVVAVTAATTTTQALLTLIWDQLLPSVDKPGSAADDRALADRLRQLTLPVVTGDHRPRTSAGGVVVAATEASALPSGSAVSIEPRPDGWSLRIDADGNTFDVPVGHGHWQESSPLGRPIVAAGGWYGDVFEADLFVITTPSRVRVVIDSDRVTTTWNIVPLVGANLIDQLRSPLITRPDRS